LKTRKAGFSGNGFIQTAFVLLLGQPEKPGKPGKTV